MVTNGKNIENIARHVAVLNFELGKVQTDLRWIKKIMGYMAGVISIAAGKIIFLG